MNRHPVILDQLGALLPAPATGGAHRPDTRLRADLRIPAMQHVALAAMIEEAWSIKLDARRVPAWRTLADVCATIADSLELEPA